MKDFSNWLDKENRFKLYENIESKLIFGQFQNNNPQISIVIPTYKRVGTLKQALDSAINQNISEDYDIIVLDNENINDSDTEQTMKEYCMKYNNILYFKNEENIGMFGNWNRGLELARTKWVTLLHDDDLLYPTYLKKVLDTFKKYDYAIVSVFSEFREDVNSELTDTDTCKGQNGLKDVIVKITHGKPLVINSSDNYRSITATPTACAFNRTMMIECGGFNEKYFPIADIICFNKMTYYHKAIILPEFLAIRRIGENEMKNVLLDCTRSSYSYLNEMHKLLYKGKKKIWISGYGATVNHLIFLAKKYAPEIDIDKAIEDIGLPKIWNRLPSFVLKAILGAFWIRLILRNKFSRGNK